MSSFTPSSKLSSPSTYLSGEATPNSSLSSTIASMTLTKKQPNNHANASSGDDNGNIDANVDDNIDDNIDDNDNSDGKFRGASASKISIRKGLIQVIDESTAEGADNDDNDNDSDDDDDSPPPLFSEALAKATEVINKPTTNNTNNINVNKNVSKNNNQEKDINNNNDNNNDGPSLMEQMMKDAINAKKKKEEQRNVNARMETKKMNFGLKKGFLNSSSSKSKSKSKKQISKLKKKSIDNTKNGNENGNDSNSHSHSNSNSNSNSELIYELDKAGNMIPIKKKEKEAIPTIRPKQTQTQTQQQQPLFFQEVQDAMKDNANSNNNTNNPFEQFLSQSRKEWNTPDLMDRISNNKVLSSGMSNPKYTAALEALQRNPKETMNKINGNGNSNEDVKEFLNEFCNVIGNHFIDLGDKTHNQHNDTQTKKKTQQKDNNDTHNDNNIGPIAKEVLRKEKERKKKGQQTEQKQMNQKEKDQLDTILADKELTSLLMDVDLQRVMSECSIVPGRMRMYMCHDVYGPKLKKLIQAGLLQVA